MSLTLELPDHLPRTDRDLITALAERNLAAHGDGFLGLVLSGSAGRGMATDRSDLDVFVVLSDEAAAGRTTAHSDEVDEIPWSRSELDDVGAFEALVESLEAVDVTDRPVLVARAADARDVLPDALRERRAKVDVVALYETVAEEPDPEAVEAASSADYVTFTSSSTVRNFVAAIGGGFPERARVVSIGPVTSEAAREAGLTVDVEAESHDLDGLVEALLADATSRTVPG